MAAAVAIAMPASAWFGGQAGELGGVAGKAVLMYAVAVAGLRLSHRRTLAQWSAVDVAAAVAVGAIVGRTAVASGQSFLVGAVALVTLLLAHGAVSAGRRWRWVSRGVDHRIRVLVDHGRVCRRELARCGLTEPDLASHLRQRGVRSLGEVRYVLYEPKGELTVVSEDGRGDGGLVLRGLRSAGR